MDTCFFSSSFRFPPFYQWCCGLGVLNQLLRRLTICPYTSILSQSTSSFQSLSGQILYMFWFWMPSFWCQLLLTGTLYLLRLNALSTTHPTLKLPITPPLSLHLQPSPPSLQPSSHAPFSLNGVQTFGTYWTEQWGGTPKYTNIGFCVAGSNEGRGNGVVAANIQGNVCWSVCLLVQQPV